MRKQPQEKPIPPLPPPTGFRCAEHDCYSDNPCCGHATLMTAAEHDAAFDRLSRACVARAKKRAVAEGAEVVEVLLLEAMKDKLSPRNAFCRGRKCAGREIAQPVGLPCVHCLRNIH